MLELKALLLDGFDDRTHETESVEDLIMSSLESNGWTLEVVRLRDLKIAYCQGCFKCWVKTPGVCVIDDAGREVTRKIVQSDLVIYFTPVTFGGYSSTLKKALDRSISLIHPFFEKTHGEYHHKRRYPKTFHFIGLGVLSERDNEQAQMFSHLIERNALNLRTEKYALSIIYPGQELEEIKGNFDNALLKVGVIR